MCNSRNIQEIQREFWSQLTELKIFLTKTCICDMLLANFTIKNKEKKRKERDTLSSKRSNWLI